MAAENKTLVNGDLINNSITTAYTSPPAGDGTRVTQITATNVSGATENYTVYIKSDTNTATPADTILMSQAVASGKSDVPPEVINAFIPAGGTIQLSASINNAIAIRVSGIEYT